MYYMYIFCMFYVTTTNNIKTDRYNLPGLSWSHKISQRMTRNSCMMLQLRVCCLHITNSHRLSMGHFCFHCIVYTVHLQKQFKWFYTVCFNIWKKIKSVFWVLNQIKYCLNRNFGIKRREIFGNKEANF